jgi:hypothetical protein
MIITKEMYDEFVESAENHSILWTDTLALIGVTVGDVPDVDVIGELEAEIVRLRRDHAALAKQLDITQRKLKGVTKLWHSDRGAALAQETQP